MREARPKRHGSVRTKLLLVLISTAVVVIVVVTVFYKLLAMQFLSPARRNTLHYADYIIQEIGVPPDSSRAAAIAREWSLGIRFVGAQTQWTIDEELVSLLPSYTASPPEASAATTELEEGAYFVWAQREWGWYLLVFDFHKKRAQMALLVLVMVGCLALVFALAYLPIRYVLRPLGALTEGVNRVAAGNLEGEVPIRNPDELGALAASFNSMTRRVKEMIRSKDQLLLDVSHELRSPLARIKVALEFLPEGQARDSIGEDVRDVEAMITEILETERLDSDHGKLRLARVDVSGLLREAVGAVHDRSPGVTLPSVAEGLFLEIDAERVRTVLRNVLENALKYSKPGGRPVEMRAYEEQESVVIRITDCGAGIPQEELAHVFEPFYRIDKSRSRKTGGYGLGLSLCKKIMEAHGGTVEIHSELGAGTTVLLSFRR